MPAFKCRESSRACAISPHAEQSSRDWAGRRGVTLATASINRTIINFRIVYPPFVQNMARRLRHFVGITRFLNLVLPYAVGVFEYRSINRNVWNKQLKVGGWPVSAQHSSRNIGKAGILESEGCPTSRVFRAVGYFSPTWAPSCGIFKTISESAAKLNLQGRSKKHSLMRSGQKAHVSKGARHGAPLVHRKPGLPA